MLWGLDHFPVCATDFPLLLGVLRSDAPSDLFGSSGCGLEGDGQRVLRGGVRQGPFQGVGEAWKDQEAGKYQNNKYKNLLRAIFRVCLPVGCVFDSSQSITNQSLIQSIETFACLVSILMNSHRF